MSPGSGPAEIRTCNLLGCERTLYTVKAAFHVTETDTDILARKSRVTDVRM